MTIGVRSVCGAFLLSLCLPGTVAAQADAQMPARSQAPLPNALEQEVLRLEEVGRQKTLRGEANWDDLIEEDAYMIAFDGSVIRYKTGQSLPSVPVKALTLSEMIARGLSARWSSSPGWRRS